MSYDDRNNNGNSFFQEYAEGRTVHQPNYEKRSNNEFIKIANASAPAHKPNNSNSNTSNSNSNTSKEN